MPAVAAPEAGAEEAAAPAFTPFPLAASVHYPTFPDGSEQSALKHGDRFTVVLSTPDLFAHDASVDMTALGLGNALPLTGSAGHFESNPLTLPDSVPDGTYNIRANVRDALGNEHDAQVTLLADSTIPNAGIQSSFTRAEDGAWEAHALVSFSGTGSESIIIRGQLLGISDTGDVLGTEDVGIRAIAASSSPFLADIAVPAPDPAWPNLGLGLTFMDEAGNQRTVHSDPFPHIELHPVMLDHAYGGSILAASNYVPGGVPAGIGIPHALINALPAGNYFAVVFFAGLKGCPSDNFEINSFIPGEVWGYDVLAPIGSDYYKAYSSAGGGCMAEFRLDPSKADPRWLWGALSNTGTSSAIADTDGIPAFAICATKKACDPIVPRASAPVPASTTASSGISSVMFLPGIKGSPLYENNPLCLVPTDDCDMRVWLPLADALVPELFMDDAGKSRRQVYVKDGDILAHAFGYHFYDAFVAQMQALAASSTAGTGWSWKPVAYDWRMALPDLLAGGAQDGSRILFGSDSPYLARTLAALASTSPTGKVTIIAHSNGGLLAKALLQNLGDTQAARLVDRLVLVGAPQTGAPRALAALLYGDGEELPGTGVFPSALMSTAHARAFAEDSPMAYHLLPSATYFDGLSEQALPLAFASSSLLAKDRALFGNGIANDGALRAYARGEDGRGVPDTDDLTRPNVLNAHLLEYARLEHQQIDAWEPPPGIAVYQIAGVGNATLSGIEQYEQPKRVHGKHADDLLYRPRFSTDGDGTVPVRSALAIPGSARVRRYWVDLQALARAGAYYDHGSLLEVPSVNALLQEIMHGEPASSTLPSFVMAAPPASSAREAAMLLVALHSPAGVTLTDAAGRSSGIGEPGSSRAIPGSQVGQIGEVKYVLVPSGSYAVALEGEGTGEATLDIEELSGGEVLASSTVADIPITPATRAHLGLDGGLAHASPLTIDQDGDGRDEYAIPLRRDETVFADEVVAAHEQPVHAGSVASPAVPHPASPAAPAAAGQVLGTSTEASSSVSHIIQQTAPTAHAHVHEKTPAVKSSAAPHAPAYARRDNRQHPAWWQRLAHRIGTLLRSLRAFLHVRADK